MLCPSLHDFPDISVLTFRLKTEVYDGKNWTPQYGTMEHPKTPGLSPKVRQGDIYEKHGRYYQALSDGYIDDTAEDMRQLPENSGVNQFWIEIPKGSFQNPKFLEEGGIAYEGDIYLQSRGKNYFRALETVFIEENEGDFTDESRWERVGLDKGYVNYLYQLTAFILLF